jgi:hypothetical protein
MNWAPHLLQVGSSFIGVPQVPQKLLPGPTGLLQAGQVRLNAGGGESGFTIERSLAFTYKKGGLSCRLFCGLSDLRVPENT